MMNDRKMSPIEEFLSELESLILRQERAIELRKEQKSEKRYIQNLLIVLEKNKIGFVRELFTSNEEKQEEFYEILKKVLSNDREYHRIVNELRNLYFLNKEHIIERKEVEPQKRVAEASIDTIIQNAKEYLDFLNRQHEELSIEEIYQSMEQLFDLAICFEENELIREIEDLDFFQNILDQMNLSSSVRLDIVSYVFQRSTELANRRSSQRKRENTYQELEDFYGESSLESTEELLEEMLGEATREVLEGEENVRRRIIS